MLKRLFKRKIEKIKKDSPPLKSLNLAIKIPTFRYYDLYKFNCVKFCKSDFNEIKKRFYL